MGLQKLKLFFIRLIVLTLIVTTIPIQSFAEELLPQEVPSNEEDVIRIPAEDADAKEISTDKDRANSTLEKGEIIEERTEDTKVFYNGNDSYTKKIYFEPIHVKEEGEDTYKEVSTDLTADTSDSDLIETENTKLESTFLSKMENGHYATFNYNEHSIAFSILEAVGENKENLPSTDVEANFETDSNQIVHKGIFPSIDLRNFTFNQNAKEDIILNEYKGYHKFTFKIETDLNATKLENGSVAFNDEKGKEVFNVPKPFMTDSNYDEKSGESQSSEDVTYEIEKIDGGYKLIVDADPKWLESPERKYPVYIDPTTSISISTDTFISSKYPTTNYSSTSSKWDEGLNQYILKVGYYDSTTGSNHGLLMNPIASIKGLNVTSATLNTYVTHHYYANSPNGLWVDRNDTSFSPANVTWDTAPDSTNIDSVSVGRDEWAAFNVTATVKSWADGTKNNYGFKLHTNGNGQTYWKKIVSSANSSLKPYLSVNYTIPTPSATTAKVYKNGNNTGYVDLSWNKIDGATGYTVWIYNGKDYEAFPVSGDGNSTTWSTKDKGIWPTTTGRYLLHHDGNGSELPVDPSQVYKNSGGNYPTATHYWFRISANYQLGQSDMGAASTPTIPNIAVPQAPTGTSYSNGNGTGYVDLNWSTVTGATSYKVFIFNGKGYESTNVGNVTSWSTKSKKIWPTATEIKGGKYELHLDDNNGAELPVDPSSTNYGYPYYWFRVAAVNADGETIQSSAYKPYITTIAKPSIPTGFTYTNMVSSKSGYVMLNWDEVDGADGYKVWIFNGKEYQSFEAGNNTTWTTQNKGIWPTQADIDSKIYKLHTDEKGTELALDPSPVYANSEGSYRNNKNYWFKVSAYDSDGHTIASNPLTPTFGEPVEFLGEEEYWSILDVPYGKVNMATGNLIVDETDFSISGRGPELGLNRTYNSLSTSVGMFGPGWHSDAELKVIASTDKSKVTLVDEDGTVHAFTKQADGTYKPPTGVYLELTEETNSYILTTTDQSKAYFSKTSGNLSSMKDGYGNTLTYIYDTNSKLKTMTDASGHRTLSFNYNTDGFVSSVAFSSDTSPSNRTVSYDYTNGFLTKVTQTAGEITSYEYEGGKLAKVYEPNHTVEKPVVNQYVYDTETNHLKEAINPKKQKSVLEYDLTNKTLVFTNPNGKKDQYKYNDAANPIEVKQDIGGLDITSNFKYEGNNLIETKDPNDQGSTNPTESYTYDADGNVLTSKDSYGTETYEYNSNNDVTSVVDTEGHETTIAYEGLDAVSETDQTGKTSSIAKYQKDSNGISNGNLLESSYALSTATNLVSNNSFENDLTSWTKSSSNDSGNLSIDSTVANGLTGTKSLKVTSQSTSSIAYANISATQDIVVEPNKTYSLSGLIKTDLTNANAFFNVQFLDSSNATLSWADNRYSQLSGSRTWTERQLSFKTPSKATKIRIYLEVDHNNATASGSAWFDMIQLEKSEVSSSYNPVINSSFNGSLIGWTGTGGSIDSTEGFEDGTSLKVVRTSVTQAASEYKQTITIGQSQAEQPFDLTVTGLSKASTVVKPETATVSDRDYSIVGNVTYSDGTTKEYIASFPISTQEWNRAAIKIPATKAISKIELITVFKGNYTGTVWFDGIRLMKGSIITQSKYDGDQNYVIETVDESGYVSSATFDSYGNTKSETDAKGETKTYEYDSANQLKNLLLANNTSISYLYDLNGNMTSKTIADYQGKKQTFTYHYDENGDLKETIGPLNDITSNEYDENGNLEKTILPKGNTITNVYDGTDRVKSVSYNDVLTYGYTYDKNGNEKEVKYEKENRSKTRLYDSSNRVTKQEDRGATQEWKYPANSDKLNEFIVNHGSLIQNLTYQYNELDLNTVVNDGQLNYRFDYDERGNVKTFTTGNGAGASFKYDDRGLVQQLGVGLKDGTDIIDETYRYDKNGNRTDINYPNGQSISYEYGKLDQLEKETLKDGTIFEYGYDGFGNRTSLKETKNGTTTTTISEYNLANQLTKFGSEIVKYDLNGNRLEDNKYIYKWDSQDQLESITKKGESTPFVSYKYDEDGRRIQKTVGTTITNFFYDGDSLNVLYETNGQDQVVRSYIYSETGQLLTMKKGTSKYFYHYNAHGDVIALTDISGKVVASYEYDAWGNPLRAEETAEVKDNPYRYAGYQFDTETGLYYLIARYYQPTHGVFISMDPDPGDEDDIITQNGYTYANNNPVMFIDPDGHFAWFIPLAIGGYRAYKVYKTYKKINKYNKAIKKLNKRLKRSGNSKRNSQNHHGYEVYNRSTGEVKKVGISGGRVRLDGKSARAEKQVRKFNKRHGNKYGSRIVRVNIRGRHNAESWERRHVRYIERKQGRILDRKFHHRP